MSKFALTLVIIGALNWGLIALFDLNLVALLFGTVGVLPRLVYGLVGIAGLWSISLLFRDWHEVHYSHNA